MKILFFGTSNVALPVLEELHRHHEIVGVVTQPDAVVGRNKELRETPVAVLAGEMKLPIFKFEKIGQDSSIVTQFSTLQPELSVVVSYGSILPQAILDIPHYKTLNIHFSLLPKYRGAAPLQYALVNGETETGITIFRLNAEMDRGPIITQEKHLIEPDDNFLRLSQRLAYASAKLITAVIPDYTADKLPLVPQDELQATYTKIIAREDGRIRWDKTAQEIYNEFRGFYPWPGIWTVWQGKNIKIMDCEVTSEPSGDVRNLGTVLAGGVIVCGQNTYLQIKSLQLEGKTETAITSFLNGYQNFVGAILE